VVVSFIAPIVDVCVVVGIPKYFTMVSVMKFAVAHVSNKARHFMRLFLRSRM